MINETLDNLKDIKEFDIYNIEGEDETKDIEDADTDGLEGLLTE